MPWSETLPQVSLAGTVLTVLLLFFAAFGEPLLGRRAFAWLSRSRDGDERALTLLHAVTMAIHVLWGLVVMAVLLLSPGLTATDLGMRLPHAWGPVLGGAVGGLIALAAFWVLVNGLPSRDHLPLSGRRRAPEQQSGGKRRGTGHRGRRAAAGPTSLPEPAWEAKALLQPRTRAERSMAAGTALTGGLFAELLYRGLFIVLLSSLGVPLWIAAVLSVLLFAVAHLYQGWWGLASAAVSGTLFTILYLGTGSIWVPVLVHVALNLRSLAFPPAFPPAERTDSSSYDDYDDYDGYEYDPYEDEYDDYGDDYADEYRDDEEVGARTDGYEDRTERPQWAEETSAYGIGAEPRPEAGGGAPPAFGGPEPGGSPYGVPGGPRHSGGPGAGVPAFGEPSTPYGAAPPSSSPPPGPSGEDAEWGSRDPYRGAPGYGATGGIPRTEDGRKLYPDEWIDQRYGEETHE